MSESLANLNMHNQPVEEWGEAGHGNVTVFKIAFESLLIQVGSKLLLLRDTFPLETKPAGFFIIVIISQLDFFYLLFFFLLENHRQSGIFPLWNVFNYPGWSQVCSLSTNG